MHLCANPDAKEALEGGSLSLGGRGPDQARRRTRTTSRTDVPTCFSLITTQQSSSRTRGRTATLGPLVTAEVQGPMQAGGHHQVPSYRPCRPTPSAQMRGDTSGNQWARRHQASCLRPFGALQQRRTLRNSAVNVNGTGTVTVACSTTVPLEVVCYSHDQQPTT